MTPLQRKQAKYRRDLVRRWLRATGADRVRLARLVEANQWQPGQLATLIEEIRQEIG
ncbi:hypothetical protein [Pseudomonas sp. OIL-1]|uniref:hypothetical protein n=1 Tax=Pseudomonas sp. OIL-1 TaxID=2706126 RepID=UPI0013A7B0F0|nr:hypothetical protein [Pseudomonas sp. OIL-1]QIB52132.1 hypothetical protein G3M63_14400 [Pseudomonas sp. OIL-1]